MPSGSTVLDPFSGTGTTGLAAAEYGLTGFLVDLNPFLVWVAETKTRNYSRMEIKEVRARAADALVHTSVSAEAWIPSIHNIERWWSPRTLQALARLREALAFHALRPGADSLLAIAFCRTMIEVSNAAFNHQSMSFQVTHNEEGEGQERVVGTLFNEALRQVIGGAEQSLPGETIARLDDARVLASVADSSIDSICTSPPYVNRMSYIRELRPYMYWLGFLTEARQAGELDWAAIGGTWGIATSRVAEWTPGNDALQDQFLDTIDRISQSSAANARLLANYVHKYFVI